MTAARIKGMEQNKLHEVSAGIGTFAGARLVTLEDGRERGVRVIEMRSGGGLDFDVAVDRSGDIGRLACDGQVVSWHSAAGLSSPWLMQHDGDDGQGFLRGFGGFLNTCGLDHIRQPESERHEHTNQENLAAATFPLHGKGTFQPATIRGHGLVDDTDQPFVFCEIEFVQGMSFASALRLRRRIEVPVGSQTCTIRDVVRNVGTNPATHMLLYHINLGFPLVAAGTRVAVGDDPCVWQSEKHDPTAPFPHPENQARNMISVFKHENDVAKVHVKSPHKGLGVEIEYPSEQLPYCQLLRMTAPGIYGIGVEPCTTGSRSRHEAREDGEMIILEPGEERQYRLGLNFTKTET